MLHDLVTNLVRNQFDMRTSTLGTNTIDEGDLLELKSSRLAHTYFPPIFLHEKLYRVCWQVHITVLLKIFDLEFFAIQIDSDTGRSNAS